MNIYVRKLVSFLLLEPSIFEIQVICGYLNTLKNNSYSSWSQVLIDIIEIDLRILSLLSDNIVEHKIKKYSEIFNLIYNFINDEHLISFIQYPPFINDRVANIKDYNVYILARRTRLNEYKKDKGISSN